MVLRSGRFTRRFSDGEGRVSGDGRFLPWEWDSDGEVAWQTDWGPAGDDHARAIRVDPDSGNLLAVGHTSDGDGGRTDVVLLRLDADTGAVLGKSTWGGSGDDVAHDFVLDGDRIYVAGQTTSWGAGKDDAFALAGCHGPWVLPREPSE